MTMPTTSLRAAHSSLGERFLGALTQRDFASLERLLAEDAWLRALLPRHFDEHYGSGEVANAFESWFGAAEMFDVVAHDHDRVAGKERISYRFVLHPDWAPQTAHLIQQIAFLSTKGGLIRKIDLLCSGFLPLDTVPPTGASHRSPIAGGRRP